MKDTYIPFYRTPVTSKQVAAVVKTLKSGWLTTGPACHELEDRIAGYLGVKYAIGVSSCTAGLHLSLLAAGVKPGDEVITTPFTFVASVEAILHCGATPIFADIDPDSFNLSPMHAKEKITDRTTAIMPVHIAGLPCDLNGFEALAWKHKLHLIHDAAHAIGAEYYGNKIGTTPAITSFSFYVTKNITTGEGGMVTTSNKRMADLVRVLSLHGMDRQAWKRYRKSGSWYYEVKELGYKYNLADLNASLGLAQFEEFDKMQKQRAASWYDRLFENVEEVTIPPRNDHSVHAWHLYIIRIDPKKLSITRDELIAELSKAGVGCSVHFIPIFLHPYYRKKYGLKSREFPDTKKLYERIITLPLYPGIRKWEVTEVVRRLKVILHSHRRK